MLKFFKRLNLNLLLILCLYCAGAGIGWLLVNSTITKEMFTVDGWRLLPTAFGISAIVSWYAHKLINQLKSANLTTN